MHVSVVHLRQMQEYHAWSLLDMTHRVHEGGDSRALDSDGTDVVVNLCGEDEEMPLLLRYCRRRLSVWTGRREDAPRARDGAARDLNR